jgi:hypothetical protein
VKRGDLDYIHDMLARLDDRLDDCNERLLDMDDKLHSLDKTADLQRVSLELHIRRTDLLQEIVTPIKKKLDSAVNISTFIFKLFAAAAVIAGIYTAFK